MKVTNAKDWADENIKDGEITENGFHRLVNFRVRSRELGINKKFNCDKISKLIEQLEELEESETGKRKL